MSSGAMVAPSAADRPHFLSLDGLRGAAAIVILFYHRRWWIGEGALPYGFLAVDFFFMLSGFVIAYAYEERLASGRLKLAGFARLRAERLGPLVLLGAILGTAAQLAMAWRAQDAGAVWAYLAAFPLSALLLPIPWFADPFAANGPSWSLFFEVIGNLVFALAAGWLTTRRLGLAIAAGGFGLVAVAVLTGNIEHGFKWTHFELGFVRMIVPFMTGILIYRLWRAGRLPRWRVPFWLLGLVLVLLLGAVPRLQRPWSAVFELACVFVLFPLVIIAGCQNEPEGRWQPLAKLGAELSYPIYIVHLPLFTAFQLFHGEFPPHTRLTLLLEAGAITIFAIAASRFYDQPVRRWLAELRRRRAPSAAPAT